MAECPVWPAGWVPGAVGAAPAGRGPTPPRTVVVRPTNTGSVPLGLDDSSPTPSRASASYHGPHGPGFLARTRADVPVRSWRSARPSRTGCSWCTSRIVSPPPSPAAAAGPVAADSGPRRLRRRLRSPGRPSIAHGRITIVAAILVKRIDGAARWALHGPMLRCVSCYRCFDTATGPTKSPGMHRKAGRSSRGLLGTGTQAMRVLDCRRARAARGLPVGPGA